MRHVTDRPAMGALALIAGLLPALASPAAAAEPSTLDDVYDRLAVDSVAAQYVVLVDTSGSMRTGDLYDRVRDSLTEFVAALAPEDHVTLISMESKAKPIWDGTIGDSPGKLVKQLPEQPSGAYTDIGAGIAAAVGSLEERGGTPIAGIVLLTDGQHDPAPDSAFPLTEGFAWQRLAERAGSLEQQVSPFAIQLRGAHGAQLLRTVFPDAQVLNTVAVNDLTTRLAQPKDAVRAAKAASLLASDLTAGIAVEWPAAIGHTRHGANATTLTLRATTRYLPLEVTDLAIRSDSSAVRVSVPPGPVAIPAGGSLALPVTVHWDAGPRSWQPIDTVTGAYRLELAATVSSPWSAVLEEDLSVAFEPTLTGTGATGRGTANRGSLGWWLAGLVGLAAVLAVLAGARWLRLHPVPGGTLVASRAEAGKPNGGAMPLRRRRSRISAASLGISGSGYVVGGRRNPRSEPFLSLTYSPDGTAERQRTEQISPRGSAEIDQVRFEWRP